MFQVGVKPDGIWMRMPQFRHSAYKALARFPEHKRHWDGQCWWIDKEHALELHKFLSEFPGVDYEPGFLELVGDLHPNTEHLKELEKQTLSLDYQFKTEPYAHQRRAVAMAIKLRAFAFLMEMGTGKSKALIDTLSYQIQRDRFEGALICCPKSLLLNWERELELHCPLPPERRRVVILSGKDRREALRTALAYGHFFVINYDGMLKLGDELAELLTRRRLAMACDESTEIKSHNSKTSKLCHSLGLRAQARYILTGSPIANSPLDAYGQFRFLDRNILGHTTFSGFKAEYAVTVKVRGIMVPIVRGYRNLARLSERIAPHSLRVLKKDCLDLPDKVFKVVEVDMGLEQAKLYKQMAEECVIKPLPDQPTQAAALVLTRLMRLQQIAGGFVPVFDAGGKLSQVFAIGDSEKLFTVAELVAQAIASEQKVVVWSRFLWEIDQLVALLRRLGTNVTPYVGSMKPEERQAAVDSIQNGDTKVLVGQVNTGGLGITLTAASTIIYMSNSFSLGDRLQSEDRAHRIGQKKNVTIIDVVCRKSIDLFVMKTLKNKKNVADVVTGDNLRAVLGDHSSE